MQIIINKKEEAQSTVVIAVGGARNQRSGDDLWRVHAAPGLCASDISSPNAIFG